MTKIINIRFLSGWMFRVQKWWIKQKLSRFQLIIFFLCCINCFINNNCSPRSSKSNLTWFRFRHWFRDFLLVKLNISFPLLEFIHKKLWHSDTLWGFDILSIFFTNYKKSCFEEDKSISTTKEKNIKIGYNLWLHRYFEYVVIFFLTHKTGGSRALF